MSCERCSARPAKLKYTELREGRSRVMWICEECAHELGFGHGAPPGDPSGPGPEPERGEPDDEELGPDDEEEEEEEEEPEDDEPGGDEPAPPLKELVLGVMGVALGATGAGPEAVPGDEVAAVRCKGCGISGAELRERTLLGCPACYETFGRPLENLLLRLHGASEHVGRLPGGRTAVPPDLEELHRQLREAIEHEDFDVAARLRDRLRRLRGRPK